MTLDDRISELVRDAIMPLLVEHLDGLEDRLVERLASELSQQATPAQPASGLLTQKDVAAILAVHPRTVQRRVAAGSFPAPILISPGCNRWRRTDVDAWIEQGGGSG